GMLPETVVGRLAPKVSELNASLPVPYRIEVGGTVEESANSQASVKAVIPLMLLVMVTFLMMQLQSFNMLALCLIVVPMAMSGVVAALLIFQQPLGFVAILGILSLIGMIARNAVILVEQIEAERAAGKAAWDAVIDAAVSRFRPIILTAISTVLGLIPIAATIFWGPMAFAVMGGFLVGTAVTLLFLPALYVTWFRIRDPSAAGTGAG
ncbi:MAG: efflux RND transporter permease subunit, partial [Acetobacteraceae bacterium]